MKASDVRAIAGGDGTYRSLVLVKQDADAILAALDLTREDLGDSLDIVASDAKLKAWLPKHRTALAFLRADDVDESVRSLAWGGTALFGVDRIKSLDAWPLVAQLAVADGTTHYDPKTAWTMVAGGDILLDRGVALAIKASGVNFPFNGGTVDITGICKDCSPFGWDLPYTERTGNKGAMRDYIEGADVAIANFENPAPNAYRFHGSGTVFSANPAYIKGLQTAGIDWVSLANNHIGDAGRAGMLQTIRNVEKYDIAHSGLGKNTKAAHKAALLKVGDTTIGLLGYDAIAAVYASGADTPGSARAHEGGPQGRHPGRAQGRRRPRRRPCPTGDRVPLHAVPPPAGAGPLRDRRRRRHGHRQPRPLGGRDGGLGRQADLVRARQLRVRPDVVHPDDGGDHASS